MSQCVAVEYEGFSHFCADFCTALPVVPPDASLTMVNETRAVPAFIISN